MQFDKTIDDQYGIIYGKKELVYIKTGRGGSIYGEDNKYLRIAQIINSRAECAVVVSANKPDMQYNLQEEISYVISEIGEISEIIYIGISNGASIGAIQGWQTKEIKNMLLINGPLMINWPKIKSGVQNFNGDNIHFAYGRFDPSYKYFGMLELINSEKHSKQILNGVDHNFKGKVDSFIAFCVNYVINQLNIEKPGMPEFFCTNYVYGKLGSGKSTFLIDLEEEWKYYGEEKACKRINAYDFAEEYTMAIREGQRKEYLKKYEGIKLFLLDDIQYIINKEVTREEVIRLCSKFREHGCTIVVTGDIMSDELEKMLKADLKEIKVYELT